MNAATRRVIVCPITGNTEPWPTKVPLPAGTPVRGAVLTDQIRSLDQRSRILRRLGTAPAEVLVAVRYQLARLLAL
jgi:mRNA interferase MazF